MAQRIEVASLAELQKIIEREGINLSVWGKDGAKTVADLFGEINLTKECELVRIDGHLHRQTTVVKMLIEEPDRGILCEVLQITPEGRRKTRKPRPPSGKIAQSEDPAVRLVKEMAEELDLDHQKNDYMFTFSEITKRQERHKV